MKLIIDIPDKVYDVLTEYQVLSENIDLEYFVIHSTPLSEELEKIKEEVEEEKIDIDLDIGQERVYNNAINDVMQIIDNHIKELKGE